MRKNTGPKRMRRIGQRKTAKMAGLTRRTNVEKLRSGAVMRQERLASMKAHLAASSITV